VSNKQENKRMLVNCNENRAKGGDDVRVIHTMHNQLHKSLTHRKRGKEGGYKVPGNKH
jgi:hypothetical protein